MTSWWTNPIASGTNRERPGTVEQRLYHSASRSSLELTVVFTTVRGTMAALATADGLARELNLSLTLLVPQVVPHRIPITRPPVAGDHTRQAVLSMISASALNADDISVQICLCRDRIECLKRWLGAGSIVLLGGRNQWRPTREQRLGRVLRAMGCVVVFADQEECRHA